MTSAAKEAGEWIVTLLIVIRGSLAVWLFWGAVVTLGKIKNRPAPVVQEVPNNKSE